MNNKTLIDLNSNSLEVRYFRLGRHALLAGLNILQLRPGDGVLVPEFICRDLLATIHSIGAIPVFYEVSRDMRPVILPEVDKICAVLAVNYFGFPQDLLPFRLYCAQYGVALIEDNAHGYLSCDKTGALLGSRGDLGIFSMRKTFTLPDGAMLMINNPELLNQIPLQLSCRNGLLPPVFWIKLFLGRLQRRTGLPFLAAGQDIVRFFRRCLTGQAIKPLSSICEFEMPPEPAPHCYSIAKLSKLDCATEIALRRRLYIEFHALFASLNIEPVFDELPVGTAPYCYPFFADNQSAKIAARFARKHGLDCIHWPDLPSKVNLNAPLHYRSLWMVNFIC